MHRRLAQGVLVLAVVAFVAGCDSNSPGSDNLLRVEGVVLETGDAPAPPAPPLSVSMYAWPEMGSDGISTVTVETDEQGNYAAELGPFPDAVVDSLLVRVLQKDCGTQRETLLLRRDLAPGDGEVVRLPTLTLSYRLRLAEIGLGAKMCAAIVTPGDEQTIGDHASLALWIDDLGDPSDDVVRGRWRLNHSASIGDDYGYFSGTGADERMILQLETVLASGCTIQLDIPIGGLNGSTLEAGELTSTENCFVPDRTVRFFDGAELSEALPPETG
jgi:hypothetical protein